MQKSNLKTKPGEKLNAKPSRNGTPPVAAPAASGAAPSGATPSHPVDPSLLGFRLIALPDLLPNPWQTRVATDPGHVNRLATDIQARRVAHPDDEQRGLLQVPIARPHPDRPGRYQLAFGHSRLAAFWQLHDTEPPDPVTARARGTWSLFPVNVRDLSDRDMAEMAARENAARKDLSAIETARSLRRLVDEFGLKQAEAGAVFGYASQSAVSNLLRLLDLPDDVQLMVHTGKLAERWARELIPLARVSPDTASAAAQKLASRDRTNHDDGADRPLSDYEGRHFITEAVTKIGKIIPASLDLDFAVPKPAPIELALPGGDRLTADPESLATDGITEIPKCNGCPFNVKTDYRQVCLRPACLASKLIYNTHRNLHNASKLFGLPIAQPGETIEHFYAGEWKLDDAAEIAVRIRHSSLRLVAHPNANGYIGDLLSKLLTRTGTSNVASDIADVGLATTDLAALKAAVNKEYKARIKAKMEAEQGNHPPKATQAAESLAGEEDADLYDADADDDETAADLDLSRPPFTDDPETADLWKARENTYHHAQLEGYRILAAGAAALASALPANDTLLDLLARQGDYDFWHGTDVFDFSVQPDEDERDASVWFAGLTVDQRRTLILYSLMNMDDRAHHQQSSEKRADTARAYVLELAHGCGITLPANWYNGQPVAPTAPQSAQGDKE